MRVTISTLDRGRPWVAQILGRCRKYGFDRQFMRPIIDPRAAEEFGDPVCYWHLPTGIYEFRFWDDQGFLCVLNGESARAERHEIALALDSAWASTS